ncbi:hypothetical protein TNCV_444991 [Trichonephila clavipes]|nr:hypothetical protein TNCV_444991 [Trichonephila clavipes]
MGLLERNRHKKESLSLGKGMAGKKNVRIHPKKNYGNPSIPLYWTTEGSSVKQKRGCGKGSAQTILQKGCSVTGLTGSFGINERLLCQIALYTRGTWKLPKRSKLADIPLSERMDEWGKGALLASKRGLGSKLIELFEWEYEVKDVAVMKLKVV